MSGNGYTTNEAVSLSALVTALTATREAHGLTIAELRGIATDHHHGTLSGCLSHLHRQGTLALLNEKRDRCRVYVLPEYVNGRETKPHGKNHIEAIAGAAA